MKDLLIFLSRVLSGVGNRHRAPYGTKARSVMPKNINISVGYLGFGQRMLATSTFEWWVSRIGN
jgi:hypothetical protein